MVVLIIGDYTARVGDPSGRSTQRPVLSDEAIDATHRRSRSRPSRSSTAIAPNCAATASGSTCPRRSSSTWCAGSPSRGCWSATTSRSGWLSAADLGAGAALPGAAGLRLGGDRLRRRARRHGPEVQPAVRARCTGLVRAAAAVDHDDADPPGHRRRPEDEQVLDNYVASPIRRRRCSGS